MPETIEAGQFAGSLSVADLAIVVGAIALLFVIAFITGRRESDTRDFFLGKRQMPMIIACLSFVATEVSAVTITANPATGYSENLQYLQFFIGSAASKIFVAFLFLPLFYRHDCTSIYEFLRARFGPSTQLAGSIFFFITRLIGSGVRLYAACMAVAIVFGGKGDGTDSSLALTLAAFTLGSILLIGFGGIKAVVWTGAYQTCVFYVAGGAVAVYLFASVTGGWAQILQIAGEAKRLNVFEFGGGLNSPTSFWAGTANAFFIGLAVFGTDQELVQRLLTVETRRSSQKAILSTILAALPILVVYLGIGTLLYVFYHQPGHPAPAIEAKKIFPYFITTDLPHGLRGLILAAIILASIDSPLSSLSSSFVSDIYRRIIRPAAAEHHYLWVSRCAVVGFGLLLALIAYACIPVSSVLWLAFQVVSITGGSMLGVFLLGMLTSRGTSRGNVAAMITNAVAMLALLILAKFSWPELLWTFGAAADRPPAGQTPIVPLAWSWLIVIGTLLTMALGLAFGPARTPATDGEVHSPRAS